MPPSYQSQESNESGIGSYSSDKEMGDIAGVMDSAMVLVVAEEQRSYIGS